MTENPRSQKNSVATPPRVRRRAAATVPAFGRYSPCVRLLQCLRSAATVPACGRYSAYVRPLQCLRATATVPPCGCYSTGDQKKNFFQRRNAASGTPACGRYSPCVRPLQSLRSAATVPAFGRYSACVRSLQCLRTAATVPACDRYSTPDPTLGSDTTVGVQWRIRIPFPGAQLKNHESSTCVTLNGSGIQLAVGPQPLWLRNHNFGLAQRIMVKLLATSRHDPLGITDSACKNQLVVVSVQYGPFNTYIPIRSTTIGKSRVARDPIAMRTSWRSNSDIASVTSIGYPRMTASGESSTTKHRLLHASGPHPIPPPNDPKTNQYNQDLGLIHSTNGNHLESPNEGSSIDHQVTIHLHAQNITMFPTNETWYFASQMPVSSSGDLILILTAQSTRNEFRMHSDY
ncbi:hypothetical protein F511_22124 [Dorcoceras hygrometricum]|uniref:Uncharacterized protein n=1 Tax=Dorcoceras hygrometricum TaxID=472368 RepID=A0A2Z7DFS0_9LAMI|nr:hypothetical protein F511_22124 [Dorcoceras hygrometricum]